MLTVSRSELAFSLKTLFPDRDRTVEGIVTMMNRLWPDNWGPRMEGALRAALSSLHELNLQRPRADQFTLLDVAPFLTDEDFREPLLHGVQDPALQAWWLFDERLGTLQIAGFALALGGVLLCRRATGGNR